MNRRQWILAAFASLILSAIEVCSNCGTKKRVGKPCEFCGSSQEKS